MPAVLRFFPVLVLSATLCGCGAKTATDPDPPPGVRKNENRKTGIGNTRKGKTFLIDQNVGAP